MNRSNRSYGPIVSILQSIPSPKCLAGRLPHCLQSFPERRVKQRQMLFILRIILRVYLLVDDFSAFRVPRIISRDDLITAEIPMLRHAIIVKFHGAQGPDGMTCPLSRVACMMLYASPAPRAFSPKHTMSAACAAIGSIVSMQNRPQLIVTFFKRNPPLLKYSALFVPQTMNLWEYIGI